MNILDDIDAVLASSQSLRQIVAVDQVIESCCPALFGTGMSSEWVTTGMHKTVQHLELNDLTDGDMQWYREAQIPLPFASPNFLRSPRRTIAQNVKFFGDLYGEWVYVKP